MLTLAGLSLSGRMVSLPSFLRPPDTTRGDSASFFALGVFSGIASSCCAPVLAGVMTLSALSGSAIGGVTLGLAYTFGMVFPLFMMALLWDRFRLGERRFLQAKPVRIRLAGKVLATNTINIAVAAAFAVMGGFVIYLANTGQMTGGPGFQVSIGQGLSKSFARIETWTDPVPEPVLGLVVLALAAVFVVATDVTVTDRTARAAGRPTNSQAATAPPNPPSNTTTESLEEKKPCRTRPPSKHATNAASGPSRPLGQPVVADGCASWLARSPAWPSSAS